MSAHQRRKGRSGELEVQRRLNNIGGDAALRYDQPEYGGELGDVNSTYGNFEVKRRASFPSWMTLGESVRGVYCRRDRGEWYVVMRAVDVETMMAENRQMRLQRRVNAGEPIHVSEEWLQRIKSATAEATCKTD